MFHKFCGILRCIQKSEAEHTQQTSDITCALNINVVTTETVLVVFKPPRPTQLRVKQKITKEVLTENISKLMALPLDLDTIQTHPSQSCSCDEIGIDPNGNWKNNVHIQMVLNQKNLDGVNRGTSTVLVHAYFSHK